MDYHLSPPVYGSKSAEQDLLDREEGDRDGTMKDASSARSPTTVFAVSELRDVFRVADDSREKCERAGHDAIERGPLMCSLATDGELSTFSDDAEEGDEHDGSGSIIRRPRFAIPRRRSLQSIFRSVGGTKRRRSDFSDDDEDEDEDRNRPSSAPPLCHANPVGSGDDGVCDGGDETLPMFPSSYSSASPFKRIRRGSGGCVFNANGAFDAFGAASSFASEFVAGAPLGSTSPTAAATSKNRGKAADRRAIFSIAPRRSTRPPSHEALPILKATSINHQQHR